MSCSRQDPTIRKGALLLSALVLTPDAALEAYRAKRVADPELDLALLEKARDILDGLAFALRSGRRSDWRHVERAWETMRKIAPPDETAQPGASAAATPPTRTAEEPARPDLAPAEKPARPGGATADPPTDRPVPPAAPAPAAPARPPAAAVGARDASPWAGSPARKPARPEPPAKPAPPPVAPALAGSSDVDETAAVDLRALRLGDGMPFLPGAAQPPPPEADEPTPAPAAGDDASGDVDETAAVDLRALRLGDGMPFAPAGAEPPPTTTAGVPELTLQQYASLCAERQLASTTRRAQVERSYGLADAEAAAALDDQWERRLSRDARDQERFDALLQQFRQWLESEAD